MDTMIELVVADPSQPEVPAIKRLIHCGEIRGVSQNATGEALILLIRPLGAFNQGAPPAQIQTYETYAAVAARRAAVNAANPVGLVSVQDLTDANATREAKIEAQQEQQQQEP